MPIINGIEVKDCIHFNPKTLRENCSEQETKKPCGTSPICYYKLLHKLEEKNNELKEKIRIYDNMSKKFRQEALEWQKISSSYKMDADKYCQALEEIKEYIEMCKQARTLNIENLKDRINEVLK